MTLRTSLLALLAATLVACGSTSAAAPKVSAVYKLRMAGIEFATFNFSSNVQLEFAGPRNIKAMRPWRLPEGSAEQA